MKRIRNIINKNKGIDFVIITKNKNEYEVLRDILIDMNYEAAIPIASLKEMMDECAEETNYYCGWRISKRMGVTWNPSIEHWKKHYSDILEINANGELAFVE